MKSKITEVKGAAISAVFEADSLAAEISSKQTRKQQADKKAAFKIGLIDVINKSQFNGVDELAGNVIDYIEHKERENYFNGGV